MTNEDQAINSAIKKYFKERHKKDLNDIEVEEIELNILATFKPMADAYFKQVQSQLFDDKTVVTTPFTQGAEAT
ncbi:MAG: hypothetical protein PHU42_03580 [Patescibacteria group bacterium]|nr:hypothetical protein [Patescibacteria group bacterium]